MKGPSLRGVSPLSKKQCRRGWEATCPQGVRRKLPSNNQVTSRALSIQDPASLCLLFGSSGHHIA